MKTFFFLLVFAPLPSLAASVTCTENNLPDGTLEKYVLYREEASAAVLAFTNGPRKGTKEEVLLRDLKCTNAKSDPIVVNCLRAAPAGSVWVSDAQLTLIKHSYLAAGHAGDALTENYNWYLRDDRVGQEKEAKKTFRLALCREANAQELDWARRLLHN